MLALPRRACRGGICLSTVAVALNGSEWLLARMSQGDSSPGGVKRRASMTRLGAFVPEIVSFGKIHRKGCLAPPIRFLPSTHLKSQQWLHSATRWLRWMWLGRIIPYSTSINSASTLTTQSSSD